MSKETRVVFIGDFSFSGYFQKKYKESDTIAPEILAISNDSDAIVINYESPITPTRFTKKKKLVHRTDPEALDFIKDKFKKPILSFANNHIFDYGKIGVIDTIEYTEKNGIPFIGVGRNLDEVFKFVIIGDEVKVAVISLQYKRFPLSYKRFCGPLQERMINDLSIKIKEIKPKVDWVVLVYHGGTEFLKAPMPTTRRKIKRFLKLGVDIVVAHHPHVVQGYEYFDGKPVFYSLGNFMFDTDYQRVQEDTDNGILLKLIFSKDKIEHEELPITINRKEGKVEVGNLDPHFINYNNVSYRKVFSHEAVRYREIRKRTKKILELERAKEKEELEIAEELKSRYNIINTIIETLKRIYRPVFKNKEKILNYIAIIIGKIRYILFYRKKGGL